MSDHIILQGTTPDALANLIVERVKFELSILQKTDRDDGEVLLTRQQAADFLSINLSTLYLWTKSKRLPAFKIAHKVFYKKSSLILALKPVTSVEEL
jgi:hypothetical protein